MLPPGPLKILFFSQGNPVAVLVTNRAGRRVTRSKKFGQAESALAWCRDHGAMLVYCPARPDQN